MQARVTRDEMLARLKASGVTDDELTELCKHSSSAPPDAPAVTRYRVRNWREYNQALIHRGSLTVWVDEHTVAGWLGNERRGCVGAPTTYADTAIRCLLTLTAVFRLPLRQTQGLAASIFALLGVTLAIPTSSTLSRRAATLVLPRLRTTKSAQLHLVIDASGLKIYGEGAWPVRHHGWTKHRTWRKLQLGVDERTGEIVAQVLTARAVADHTQVGPLLRQVPGRVQQVSADGGYAYTEVYRSCDRRRVWLTIPPRRGAAPGREPWLAQRNASSLRMQEVGRDAWKREVG